MAPAALLTGGGQGREVGRVRHPGRRLGRRAGRWVGLLVLVVLGMVVVVVWGDEWRPHVHAFLQNVLRRV